jgi:hypothetical protein
VPVCKENGHDLVIKFLWALVRIISRVLMMIALTGKFSKIKGWRSMMLSKDVVCGGVFSATNNVEDDMVRMCGCTSQQAVHIYLVSDICY